MWPDWLRFRPIVSWPGPLTPDSDRRRSPFSAGLSSTVDLLRRELTALQTIDGSDVLQVALAERDLRQDGKPRSGARAAHPGVILSFTRQPSSTEFRSKGAARAYLIEVAQVPSTRVATGLSDAELFRRAARHVHPDHGGAPAVWRAVAEANRLLSQEDAYQFAVDSFRTWEDNLRAIALGLEALRKVERYGITKGTEQYAGWKQLTAKAAA